MDIVIAGDVEAAQVGEATRKGRPVRQNLINFDQPDGFAFRVVRSHYQGGGDAFETPRLPADPVGRAGHHELAPQQDIPEGDLAYSGTTPRTRLPSSSKNSDSCRA